MDLSGFLGFLQQALTLGLKRVSPRKVPQLLGFGLYVGIAALIVRLFAVTPSRLAALFSFVVLGLLLVLVILLILHGAIRSWMFNLLVLVVVLSFTAAATFAIVRIVNAETPKDDNVMLSGRVTYENKDDARHVDVGGYGVSQPTNNEGKFQLGVPRSHLDRDSVRLSVAGPAGNQDFAWAVTDRLQDMKITIRNPPRAPGAAPGAEAYRRLARAASESLSRVEQLIRERRFKEGGRVAAAIVAQGASLRAAVRGSMEDDPALHRLGEISRTTRDSLAWLAERADSVERASAGSLVHARQLYSMGLVCDVSRLVGPIVDRDQTLANRYPDYKAGGEPLEEARRLFASAQDSLTAIRYGGTCR